MYTLKEQTVIISGGSQGIGKACARLFASHGANVMIASRNQEMLQHSKAEILAALPEAKIDFLPTDVTNISEVKRLFDHTLHTFGPLQTLITCAGALRRTPFSDLSLEDWQYSLDVNLTGTMLCCQEAFQQIKSTGKGGSIITMSSLGGIRGTEKFPGYSAYVASKFAIIGLTESLAVEGKPYHIRVNAIAPGAVTTPLLEQADSSLKSSTSADDIAKIALFFADWQQSGKISGSTLEVYSNE